LQYLLSFDSNLFYRNAWMIRILSDYFGLIV
jgi:hypothetical protein